MLFHDAALSYLHFVFAFMIAGALAGEALVLRLPVDGRAARLLLRIDLFYAIGAVGAIAAGVARVFWGAKSADYYAAQPFFWGKMATFAAIGLISIGPTRAFIGWAKQAGKGAAFAVAEADARRIGRWVRIELLLLALVPLFAALMARAIGS